MSQYELMEQHRTASGDVQYAGTPALLVGVLGAAIQWSRAKRTRLCKTTLMHSIPKAYHTKDNSHIQNKPAMLYI